MTAGRPPGALFLDGAALRRLAERSPQALATLEALRAAQLLPVRVPSFVLADALTGDTGQDRLVEAFLPCCEVVDVVPPAVARRAAWLRTAAARGSATDALLVALAEPGGAVLVANRPTVEAMALFADGVFVERLR